MMVRQLFVRSGIYFVGLAGVKLLTVFLFVFLARFLQPDLFGKLSFFLTLVSLITIVADWGLVQWYQIYAHTAQPSFVIAKATHARLLTLLISASLFIVYVSLSRVFSFHESVIFLFLLFSEAFTSFVDGYYLVRKQSYFIALKQFSKYMLSVVYVLVVGSEITLLGVLTTYLISSFLTMLWYTPKVFYQFFNLSLKNAKETLKHSSSYAFLILTSAFYSRGDAIILQSTVGNAALGLYSAGYRYLDAMSLFPSAFAQNLFHLSAQPKTIDKTKVLKMTAVMGTIGLLFGGFLFFASHFLTVGLLGEAYQESQLIVKVFGVVTMLLFLNSPLSTIVQSSTLVKKFLPWGVANTLLNLSLNMIVIPVAGGVGAAFVMLLTEATGLLINIYFVKQRLRKQ
jgi:O-antigen/teichoic acid export membrane protein